MMNLRDRSPWIISSRTKAVNVHDRLDSELREEHDSARLSVRIRPHFDMNDEWEEIREGEDDLWWDIVVRWRLNPSAP